VLYNGNSLDATGKSATTFDIGDNTYPGNQVGTLSGEIDFNNFAPYAGLGWNTAFDKEEYWDLFLNWVSFFRDHQQLIFPLQVH